MRSLQQGFRPSVEDPPAGTLVVENGMAVSSVYFETAGVSLAIWTMQSVWVQDIDQKGVALFFVHERIEREEEHGWTSNVFGLR
jgi:hypothetical protein